MARVSNTPGRTQEANFFSLGDYGLLVDLPGYGYAQVSKEKRLYWGQFIFDYLKGRSTLHRVYVLIDSRHGLKEVDLKLFTSLNESAVSYQILFTKCDKVTKKDLVVNLEKTQEILSKQPAAHPHIICTSSETGEGLNILKSEIAQIFLDAPRAP